MYVFWGGKAALCNQEEKTQITELANQIFFQINNEINASVTSYNRNVLFASNDESIFWWQVSSHISFLSFLGFFSVIFQIFHNDFNFNVKDNSFSKNNSSKHIWRIFCSVIVK